MLCAVTEHQSKLSTLPITSPTALRYAYNTLGVGAKKAKLLSFLIILVIGTVNTGWATEKRLIG